MKKRLFICLLVLTLLTGVAFAFSASGESLRRRSTVTIDKAEYDRLKRYEKLDEVLQYVQAYYYKDPDVDAMLDTAIQGLLAGLADPYTFYYDEENWKSMWEDEEGEYTGIGIQLLGNYADQTVKITRVFRDTPAQAVGMRKNDVLVRVEDIEVTTETMQAAASCGSFMSPSSRSA